MRKKTIASLTSLLALAGCGQAEPECQTDFDCAKETVCQNNTCVPLEKEDTGKIVNGVKIHQGITNSKGNVSFVDHQTNENVEFRTGVESARVTFIDGDGFEGFITKHNNYLPSFEIFPHNSSHSVTLLPGTSGFSKITQKRYENPTTEFITPMHELVEWGKESALEYQGCQTRDEFIDNYKDTLSIISHVASVGGAGSSVEKLFSVVGKTIDYVLKASDFIELDETEIIHIYRSNKIVPDFNSLFEGSSYQAEDCFDTIDNDCDGLLDLADPDCEGADCIYDKDICTPNNEMAKLDSCGKVYDKVSCTDGECRDGACIVCSFETETYKCTDPINLGMFDNCDNYLGSLLCPPSTHECISTECLEKEHPDCEFSHYTCTDSNTWAIVNTCDNVYAHTDCDPGEYCQDGGCKTDNPDCTFSYNTCLDSKTKAAVDTCGNTYNTQTCPDKCVDGSCTTSSNCEPLVGTCLDDYTTGWKDQCGNSGQTGTCTGGQVCEGNGNCVDDVEECDTSKFTDFYCVTNKLAKSVETCPDGTGVLLYCAANETCVDGKCVD